MSNFFSILDTKPDAVHHTHIVKTTLISIILIVFVIGLLGIYGFFPEILALKIFLSGLSIVMISIVLKSLENISVNMNWFKIPLCAMTPFVWICGLGSIWEIAPFAIGVRSFFTGLSIVMVSNILHISQKLKSMNMNWFTLLLDSLLPFLWFTGMLAIWDFVPIVIGSKVFLTGLAIAMVSFSIYAIRNLH